MLKFLQWDQGSGSALTKSLNLVEPLKHWNLTVFGHLKQRKASLLARLNGIQRTVDYFTGLFCSNQLDNTNPSMPKLFPGLWEDELNPLVASIDINELCGNGIFDLVTEAFRECRIPEGLNATLVISKVIVARLRPLLAKLVIKPEFYHGAVLKEVGLPANLIHSIMHVFLLVTYQVCVNGELTETFTPKNGIRQGDPLSPYLFVLCMEKFSHLIVEAVKNCNWKPVKSSQGGPCVSHLFFADDLILFAEATPRQAHTMKQCMDDFCRASGQVVNFEKSAIYCSPNISKELASDISHICGSPLTNNLGKYLGMPLLHSRVTKTTYNNLVDKVHARLASWKSRVLSSAGRATLIHAVTSAIPVFAMQTAKLPMSICDELDNLNRNFFWGGKDGVVEPVVESPLGTQITPKDYSLLLAGVSRKNYVQ
ncbi:unnamed protein product [Prunus brigantina]